MATPRRPRAETTATTTTPASRDKHDDDAHLWLFLGREREADPLWDHNMEAAVRIRGPDQYADSLLGFEMAAGDIDGDGADDLLAYEDVDNETYVVSGAQLQSAQDQRIDDIALQEWHGGVKCLTTLGDWNDDGYVDWVSGHSLREVDGAQVGTIHFIAGGSGTASADVQDSPGYVYGASDGQQVGSSCRSGDMDGDGVLELLTSGDSSIAEDLQSFGIIRRDDGLPEGSSLYAPDLEYLADPDYFPSGVSVPRLLDWDGDGDDDLEVLGYYPEEDGLMSFTIIPGWDIPWDDPQYW